MGARSSVDGRRSVRESFVRRVRRVKEKKKIKKKGGKRKREKGRNNRDVTKQPPIARFLALSRFVRNFLVARVENVFVFKRR